jgi:Glycosyl transferase family 2
VTVVMPAYNAEPYVSEAIAGVLSQSYRDFELIVVDDGSSDDTRDAIAAFRDDRLVVAEHDANRGVAAALNTGLQLARGEYIAVQHADDVSLPQRLAAQVAVLDRHPEIVIVGSSYELIDASGAALGRKMPPASDAAIRWRAFFMTPFGHPTVMFRAKLVRACGLAYEPDLVPAEDYGLWSKILAHGRGINIEQALVRYRIHPGQSTAVTWELQNEIADGIALANLRAAGVEVVLEDIPILRRLHYEPPYRMETSELPYGVKLLEASRALVRDELVDRRDAREIARGILEKCAVYHSGSLRSSARFAGLAARRDPRWLTSIAVRQAVGALFRRAPAAGGT